MKPRHDSRQGSLAKIFCFDLIRKLIIDKIQVVTVGCGWNYDQNGFDYHAGGEYDELAIWTRSLINNASLNELPFMMGGYCKYLTYM